MLASYGDTTGVDAFHLDLSGTLQGTVAAEFATILPLVLKSRARCLAVTVPDARRNKILESWPSYSRRARARLGKGWRQVLERLVAHQAALPAREDLPAFMILFDPPKAAKRELGLMLDLFDHFSAERTGPTEMVRYAYVSRYGNSPFRMRTYFFRLGAPGTFSSNNVSAGTWLSSPLYFGNDEGMALIPEAPAETFLSTTEGKSTSMSESRLAAVARALGGPELAEYERLMDAEKRLQSLTAMVNGASPSASPAAPPQAHRKKRYDDLSPKEKIEWVDRKSVV